MMRESNLIDEGLSDVDSLLGEWLQPDCENSSVVDLYANSSGYGNGSLSPDAGIAEPAFKHAFVYIPIQIIVSVAAMIANMLTLVALARIRTKFQPHLMFVVNLTLSDMLFGLRNVVIRSVVLGFEFNDRLRDWFKEICVRGLIRVAGSAIYTCTYVNLLAIAVDLYFAVFAPFLYQKHVTRRRTVAVCVSLWLLSVVFAGANYWVSVVDWVSRGGNSTFCAVRATHVYLDVYTHLAIVYLGLLAMTYLYVRIFVEIRRCVLSTPGLPIKKQQAAKRNRRKLVTSLLVLITFLVAWLPNGIFTTMFFIMPDFGGPTVSLMGSYFATLPMLNSLCDPIIYAIRLDKVRHGDRRSAARNGCGVPESTEMVNLSVNSAAEHHVNTEPSQRTLLARKNHVSNGDYGRDLGNSIGY